MKYEAEYKKCNNAIKLPYMNVIRSLCVVTSYHQNWSAESSEIGVNIIHNAIS